MPKEWIDVVDSAIKIALGGVVTAMGTYVLAGKNNRHEIDKTQFEFKKKMLTEIAVSFEKARIPINRFYDEIKGYDPSTNNKVELVRALLANLTEARDILGEVKAKSNLMRYKALFSLLNQYLEELGPLNDFVSAIRDDGDLLFYSAKSNEININLATLDKKVHEELARISNL